MTTSPYAMDILSSLEHPCMAISANERAFFERLGARIAELRKQQDITQVEMAKALSISQQTINSYEVGRPHVPVSALSTLQQQMERIQHLPRAQQRFIIQVIDTVLAQQGR